MAKNRSNPTDIETPVVANGKASPIAKRKEEPAAVVFNEFDALDEQAILMAQEGKALGRMIYNIPYRSGAGSKQCDVRGCPYKGEPHVHAADIGIEGVDELIRIMGGIEIRQGGVEVINLNGQAHYKATAEAIDHYNFIKRSAVAYYPFTKIRRGMEQYAPTTAMSFAERNAAKRLIPQAAREQLRQMGLQGRETFTEEDVARIYAPILKERKAFKMESFRIRMAMAAGAPSMEMSAGIPSEPDERPAIPDELPEKQAGSPVERPKGRPRSANGCGQKTAPAPSEAATRAQLSAIAALLTRAGYSDGADKYISEKVKTSGQAADLITVFNDGDYTSFDKWRESQNDRQEGLGL